MLERWERVHGVIMMPLLILKAAALMSWNWTIRGFLGSHQGSKRSEGSAPLALMAIVGLLFSVVMLMLAVVVTVVIGTSSGSWILSLVKMTWQSSSVLVGG